MENFLNEKIDSELFCDHVYEFSSKLRSACEKFEISTNFEFGKD